jgi:hypothetical protein
MRRSCVAGLLACGLAPVASAEPVEAIAAKVRAREVAFAKSMADRDHAAFATFVSEEAVFVGRTALRGRHAVARAGRPTSRREGSFLAAGTVESSLRRSPSAPAPSSTPTANAPALTPPPGASRGTGSGGSSSTTGVLPAAAHEGAVHARPRPRLPRLRRGVPARCRPLRGLRGRARGPLRGGAGGRGARGGTSGRAGFRARGLPCPRPDPAGGRPRPHGRAAAGGRRRVPSRGAGRADRGRAGPVRATREGRGRRLCARDSRRPGRPARAHGRSPRRETR